MIFACETIGNAVPTEAYCFDYFIYSMFFLCTSDAAILESTQPCLTDTKEMFEPDRYTLPVLRWFFKTSTERLDTKSLINNCFFKNQSDLWFWSWNHLDIPSPVAPPQRKNRWCLPWRKDVVGLLPWLYKDLGVDEDGTALKLVDLGRCSNDSNS